MIRRYIRRIVREEITQAKAEALASLSATLKNGAGDADPWIHVLEGTSRPAIDGAGSAAERIRDIRASVLGGSTDA